MPITIKETFDSLKRTSGQKPTKSIEFFIAGSDDEDAIMDAIAEADEVPYSIFDSYSRTQLNRSDFGITKQLDKELWMGSAQYGSEEKNKEDGSEPTFCFETTGGTQKILQSIKTVNAYPVGIAPDYGGAIGVTEDSIEGVDITVPIYTFSETWYFTKAQVTDAFKGAIFALTGNTNDAPFRGCDTGECLFLGASGAAKLSGTWEINFKFAAQKNVTFLSIGDIKNITKRGWDYLWVRYEKKEIGVGADKTLAPSPKYVYVEQVYPSGDFTALGI